MLTTNYTPQKNGVYEKKHMTIVEMEKNMMKEKGLPTEGKAVKIAIY